MNETLGRAIVVMLDKLYEHNPKTGYSFAAEHGLTDYLTMLIYAHAYARDAIPEGMALERIEALECKT